jgi:hypothetical protein
MDKKENILEKYKWILPVLALIVGLGIGLVVAWVIIPVEYVDATPEYLREDLQVDYLRMAIDSYSVNKEAGLAVSRYDELGEYSKATLEQVGADPKSVSTTAIQNYRAVVEIFQPEETETGGSTETANTGTIETSSTTKYLIPVCGVTIVLGILFAGAIFLRNRQKDDKGKYIGKRTREEKNSLDSSELDARIGKRLAPNEPFATFRTIYTIGDDLYDDSFSIEGPSGDFLGECGVGIGDIIGTGEPKKVSAFEVWLFDKNDIQTVTKVVMSKYAYNDEETLNRLAAKGDPVIAENGGVIELETASLRIEARIVDLIYGQGALPSESFFERVTMEVVALPRTELG